MEIQDLRVERLGAALGARVSGIDLRQPLETDLVGRLRSLLFEHQVLFFRGQELTDDEHIAFASNFGRPNVYPLVEMAGSNRTIEFVWDGPDRKPTAANWHTDVTWLQDPPRIGMLAAQKIPENGGDTLWCSLYSVHDALPAELREQIREAVVRHSAGPGFVDLVVRPMGEAYVQPFREKYGNGSRHELVRTHAVTGRPLVYLAGAFMDHIEGLEVDVGRALLRRLMEIADDPVHHIRWKWSVHDVALWDERSTMHHVDTSHWPEPRRMRRCTVS